eukprot:CAMPEP_0198276950 /NCGR_PEP_ID=MMETSP1447-20131203/65585_1 /TAXON_ID=420782 /ORGANISM="Chaetoceros dichaeta, Strain CCMP1751" /LENGTH=174 /DNA_ID=CAMNT_0043971937 /DNA_START=834 /DNA_END=1358 /DNA_ORIENTATION=-
MKQIKELASKNKHFSDPSFSHHKIDSQLIISGGDLTSMWGCDMNSFAWFGGCYSIESHFDDVYDELYEAKIPMIITVGNHDFKIHQTQANQQSDTAIWNSYAKSKKIEEEKGYTFTYEYFHTKMTRFGKAAAPRMGLSEFRDLQIINFGMKVNNLGTTPALIGVKTILLSILIR